MKTPPATKKEDVSLVSLSGGVTHQKGEMPKSGALARMKTDKEIPVTNKGPRRQRSSRFHVTERFDLEKLPAFKGLYYSNPSTFIYPLFCLFANSESRV